MRKLFIILSPKLLWCSLSQFYLLKKEMSAQPAVHVDESAEDSAHPVMQEVCVMTVPLMFPSGSEFIRDALLLSGKIDSLKPLVNDYIISQCTLQLYSKVSSDYMIKIRAVEQKIENEALAEPDKKLASMYTIIARQRGASIYTYSSIQELLLYQMKDESDDMLQEILSHPDYIEAKNKQQEKN